METFYEITGVPEILSIAEYVSFGTDENFEKAGKELLDFDKTPDPPSLLKQFVSPPKSLSEEDTFNW